MFKAHGFVAVALIWASGCSPSDDQRGGAETAPPAAVIEQPPARPAPKPAAPTPKPAVEPEEPPTEPAAPFNPLRGDKPSGVGRPPPPVPEPPAVEHPPPTTPESPDAEHHPDKPAREPFDPIKINGPIFVGWPKPKLALVITGRQEGYLEPCGCAGLNRMKGGMSRRHTLFKTLRNKKGWAVVGLDVGGISKGFGRQAELKFHTMVEGMRKMGYDAIGLGKTDLRLPAGELVAAGDPRSPFISANVGLFGFDAALTEKYRIIEAAGMKLGIASILGKKFQKEIHNDEIELADPQTALKTVLPDLKEKADYLILLAHATMEESLDLARKFPDFDLVVTAGGGAAPPADCAVINGGKTRLVEVGEMGMDAIVLAMFDDPQQKFRYQRVPLDSRFAASAEMKLLMTAYQDELKRSGFSGLGLRAVPHPQEQTHGKFVGSKKCQSCHEPSYDIWRKSGHGRAYKTLAELDPPRQFDPECISCHVIGWHPTGFFPYQGGYRSRKDTPQLIDTGCESCHGPGGAHVKAEMGSDETLKEKFRKTAVVTKAQAENSQQHQCRNCHDGDNSPDFDFKTYWPKIEHYEQ